MGEVFKYIFLHKKRMLKIGLVIALIAIIIFFSAAQYLIVLLDGGTNNDKGNVPSAVRKYNEGLFGDNGIGVEGDENGYWYKIDFNEVLKDIIEELEKEDGKLDVYLSSSNKVKYLKKMIKAEYITQYPDLRRAGGDYRKENVNKPDPNDINSDINDDLSLVDTPGYEPDYKKFQGCIEFKRHTSDGTEILLQYTPYEDLKNKIIRGTNSDVLNYFSVDDQGNLVVATYTKTITKKLEREPFEEEREEDDIKGEGEGNFNFYKGHLDNERTTTTEEIVYTERKLNYKSLVKKYTMPFEYLWGLLVCGRDEEFVSDLADLVLDSKIEIGIYDNLTEIEDMQVDTWREKIYSASKEAQKDIKVIDEGNGSQDSEYDVIKWKDSSSWNWDQELNNPISSIRYYNVDYKKTDINTCTNKITYADIWYVKEKIEGEVAYTRTESKPVESIKIKDSEKRINDLNEFLKDENREDLKPGANSEDYTDTNTPDNPNNVVCKWQDNGSDKSYYDVNTLDDLGEFLKSKTEEEDKNKKLEYEKGNWNPSYADIHSGAANGKEYWEDQNGNKYLGNNEHSNIQYVDRKYPFRISYRWTREVLDRPCWYEVYSR